MANKNSDYTIRQTMELVNTTKGKIMFRGELEWIGMEYGEAVELENALIDGLKPTIELGRMAAKLLKG